MWTFKRKDRELVDCDECRWFDHDKIECQMLYSSGSTADMDFECCGVAREE